MPSAFATLAFDEQLHEIARAVECGRWAELLDEAATLPDVEPLCRLLEALDESSALASVTEPLRAWLPELGDPQLQYLLGRCAERAPLRALCAPLLAHALESWPLSRVGALVLMGRWLRRHDVEAYEAVGRHARARLEAPEPDDDAGRALLFVTGQELLELAERPGWLRLVERTVHELLDTLARAPKSISQANAEGLLSRRVYVDPGHFFFELLQNADDAGATSWRACIRADGVHVTHDGAPFDLRDVVGLLSIGQTTKRADQIGFFGVGFKSVYEICERPRIHSGVFDFEIAHVSIPRALSGRPDDVGEHQTALVLPFAGDPRPEPKALFVRAAAIPPETLLTLPHLREFEVEGEGASVGFRLEEVGDEMHLVEEGSDTRRRFHCAHREVRYEGEREAGRSRKSPVLVAIELAASGSPSASHGPTLFSFLPTAERTGLRFIVHARFDVTVDRERLVAGSPFNAALLAEAGRALADAALLFAERGHSPLGVLPIPSELTSPGLAPLFVALEEALRGESFLALARGGRSTPAGACVVEPPALARALAELDLGAGRFALAELEGRAAQVALGLGAAALSTQELASLLGRELVAGGPAPAFFESAREVVLEGLTANELDSATLRALPLLRDGGHSLCSAEGAALDTALWARLCAGVRALVTPEEVAALPFELRRSLDVPDFDRSKLVDDLRLAPRREALLKREDELLRALEELGSAAASLRSVALLRDTSGDRVAAESLHRLDPELAALGAAIAKRSPLLAKDVELAHPALCARWVPRFDLAALADAMHDGLVLDADAMARLYDVLDARAETLSPGLARRIASAPAHPDVHGQRRALLGDERALLAGADGLSDILPEWPWARCSGRDFTRALPIRSVDASALADALGQACSTPTVDTARLAAVYQWLAPRAGQLPREHAERLTEQPAWLAEDGERYPLAELRRTPESSAIAAFYEELESRPLADEACLPLVRALGLEHRLPPADCGAVVQDLVRLGAGPDVDRSKLAEVLDEAAATLPASELAPLLAAPLFLDENGVARRLASFAELDEEACHRPGAFRALLTGGALPLLAPEEERRFEALLAVIGPDEASLGALICRLTADPTLLASAEAASRARRALVTHAEALDEQPLDEESRARLNELPLFTDPADQLRSARELAAAPAVAELLGPELIAAFELGPQLLGEEQELERAALKLDSLAPRELLEARVLPQLRDGQCLHELPEGARHRRALARLLEAAVKVGLDVLDHALVLDAGERLVVGARLGPSTAERALARRLPLAAHFADEAWREELGPELRAAVAPALKALTLASALREACPEEAPRAGHPILDGDALTGLYDWLRERGAELESDEAALSALGSAAVLPSERGTLRAPRQLVLDPQVPDLGLDWGLSDEVPDDVGAWLGRGYELERSQRAKLAEHVLDGLDAAAQEHDGPRAAELLRFLARALGADEDAERLEQRARRTKVYARLRVPTGRGTWEKPRRLWIASDDEAKEVLTFLYEPPSRVQLPGLDTGARALLVACGARADLDPDHVEACLKGDGLEDGAGAAVALARYVARSALATPERRQRWKLDSRQWVPDRAGGLRRPAELYWPDATVDALLGDAPELLPDESLVYGVAERLGQWLPFRHGRDVRLVDVAGHLDERGTPDATLSWLEEGLREKRFSPAEVGEHLSRRLRLRDVSGSLRAPDQLAVRGARALFGSLRGDWPGGASLSKLARALAIPATPDTSMILEFLDEVGEVLEGGASPGLEHELAMRLPGCLERLSELDADADFTLGEGSALAGLQGGAVVLVRLGDPRLCMLEPPELAEALESGDLLEVVEPMPAVARSESLRALLWRSGVPDLFSLLRVRRVQPGPVDESRGAELAALRRRLKPLLPDAELVLVDGLTVRGEFEEPVDASLEVRVDAALHEGKLWLTHDALDDLERLAPALAPEPRRRARVAHWLEETTLDAEASAAPADAPPPRERPKTRERGLFHRVRRLFGGGSDDESDDADAGSSSASRRGARTQRDAAPDRQSGANFFQPSETLGSQLDGTDGWLESRLERPDFGLAFAPASVPAPWVYASKMVASRFDRAGQLWRRGPVAPASSRGDVGTIVFRGRLPEGVSVLPVPTFGRVADVDVRDAAGDLTSGSDGTTMLRLDGASRVTLRMTLGQTPDLASCRPATEASALRSFVPDGDLPDEVHDFLAGLETDIAPATTASAVRDFVRTRYRYDPSYLEDPSVGRFLARVTHGRASAHIAALHVSADSRHLGAGVCYELNSLACELMRRAGVPAAITTGWVLNGGTLSEPDHLWAVALLTDAHGEAVRLPIDASSTRDGRPLRVPRRAPGSFRAPKDPKAKAPRPPKQDFGAGDTEGPTKKRKRPRRHKPPRAELLRVLRYLERRAGRELSDEERVALLQSLGDADEARAILDRLSG